MGVSRIRQIKPSWFLDKELRRGTSADAREFYIGLWILADDAGYLVWDTERIGAELYPFDAIRTRERHVEKWAGELETLNVESPHLIVWDCGHGRVPKMPDHQRIAGTQSFVVAKRHREECRDVRSRLSLPVATTDLEPQVASRSHGIGRVGNGKERNGTVGTGAGAQDAPRPSEWQQKVPRATALPAKVPA
jgi:hypothetical protein